MMRNPIVLRGFVFLELLLVLVVIALLAGGYFSLGGGKQADARSTYQTTVMRSKNTACIANRATLRQQMEMFRMTHPGEQATSANMRKAGVNPAMCPEGGSYGLMPDGRIVCSKHPD